MAVDSTLLNVLKKNNIDFKVVKFEVTRQIPKKDSKWEDFIDSGMIATIESSNNGDILTINDIEVGNILNRSIEGYKYAVVCALDIDFGNIDSPSKLEPIQNAILLTEYLDKDIETQYKKAKGFGCLSSVVLLIAISLVWLFV